MPSIAAHASVALRNVDELVQRAVALDDESFARPSLPGWTVCELLDHTAQALHRQAVAFGRTLEGSLEQPEFPHPQGWSPDRVRTELSVSRERMHTALGKIAPEHSTTLTPMPFAVVPTPVAVSIAVAEYGMHRWDLERALGVPFDLPPDTATISFALMNGLLPMLARAGRAPDREISLAFRTAEGPTLSLRSTGEGWVPEIDAERATCRIDGTTSDLVMFLVGRLRAGEASIEASGSDRESVSAVKAWFPGP